MCLFILWRKWNTWFSLSVVDILERVFFLRVSHNVPGSQSFTWATLLKFTVTLCFKGYNYPYVTVGGLNVLSKVTAFGGRGRSWTQVYLIPKCGSQPLLHTNCARRLWIPAVRGCPSNRHGEFHGSVLLEMPPLQMCIPFSEVPVFINSCKKCKLFLGKWNQ